MRKTLRFVAIALGGLVSLIATAWAAGALYFDLPIGWLRAPFALVYGVAMLAALLFIKGRWRATGVVAAGFVAVLGWWLTIKPSNARNWQPDVAQLGWAEVNGDEVILHNVRNCDYRTETDYTARWETRTVRLSQVTGVDLAISYWGSPWIAHPIASFQFANAPPICFSIEARKQLGQTYSAIGALYRQFELIYVVADERDVIRVRTNYRQGEDIYLYALILPLEEIRGRFLEYVHHLSDLRARPEWYNAFSTNCTTSIRAQHDAKGRMPWDWRILVNGKADEMLYELGMIDRSMPFADLKRHAYINDRARSAGASEDFSKLIRVGVGEKNKFNKFWRKALNR